jgi:RHS repeat-associated protein
VAGFVYDGDGNRVSATLGVTTTYYVGNYLEVTDGEVTRYYYAGEARVAMRKGPAGQAGTLFYLFGDHLGSTAVTADSSGTRLAELRYTPWGESRFSAGDTPTPLRFTGQREDATIGLYFYNARYYDPYLNRWIQPDSIIPDPANPQSLNRYSYVRNNPLRYTDPSGQCEVCKKAWNWLQVQYHKLQERWFWHNPWGLSADPGCGMTRRLPNAPSEIARRSAVASGSPVDPQMSQAVQWAEQLASLVSQFGNLWGPNAPIGRNEAVPLTEEQGLQISTGERFENVVRGQHGDLATRYLWTIDEQGVKIAWEQTPFDTDRGKIVPTNLSPEGAFFAGELWFVSDDELVINAGSGRYGYLRDDPVESARRYEVAIQMWEALGYRVTVIPLEQR